MLHEPCHWAPLALYRDNTGLMAYYSGIIGESPCERNSYRLVNRQYLVVHKHHLQICTVFFHISDTSYFLMTNTVTTHRQHAFLGFSNNVGLIYKVIFMIYIKLFRRYLFTFQAQDNWKFFQPESQDFIRKYLYRYPQVIYLPFLLTHHTYTYYDI